LGLIPKGIKRFLQNALVSDDNDAVCISTETVEGVHIEISFVLRTDAAGLSAMLDQAHDIHARIERLPNVANMRYDERIGLSLNKNFYPEEHKLKGVLNVGEQNDGNQKEKA